MDFEQDEEKEIEPITEPKLSFTDVLRFAAHYWSLQKGRISITTTMVITAALVETYLPTALSQFLGAVKANADHAAILRGLLLFLAAYATQILLVFLSRFIYNAFETNLFKAIVDDAFTHVQRLPERFFLNTFTGSIISKINRARQKIETFEDQILLRLIPTLTIVIGSIAFMALQFPTLAALLTAYLVTLTVVSSFLVFRISGPAQSAYADAQDDFGAHLADSVSGIATTKSYAQEPVETSRFLALTTELRRKNLRAYLLGNLATFAQHLMLVGMLALLLGGGIWYLFNGKATIESIAYLAYAHTIMQSAIRELGDNIKNLLTASYDLHAIIALLRQPPESGNGATTPDATITHGAITFDKVSFTYPGKAAPVFKNFSVSIRAGERVALVGHSGSGKTSFVRLLQCLYQVQTGAIRIDNQDITHVSRHSLRSAIALVPQDPILFHRSLAENISYGRPEASMAQIQAAARQAHIEEFILGLPQQFDTLVGERGIKLSGGERQRIAIARAILADRPILILDEATSALDSVSEQAVQQALHSLTHGRTSIMIAHRLSTIRDADRILVFDQGQIVEQGTHENLLKSPNGIYASFFKLQSGGFIDD